MVETKPHVVHVLDSLQVGGTENGVVNLARGLDPAFRESLVAVTSSGPLAGRLPGGMPVHVLGKRPGLDFRPIVRLTRLLRRLRPDIVHSRNWGALDAVLAARLARVPVVIHGEHGREASDPYGLDRRRNRLRRVLAPLVSRFTAVSRDLGRWLVETVGISSAKVTVIHNGVDIERFSEGSRAPARRLLGLTPDTVVIGTVGRLDPVKDQVGLLEAFASLGPSPSLALVLVGDGPCRGLLTERASRADLVGRVHLLGERRDVPTLLPGLDVFTLPSLAEGLSNTVLEAMAAGLPVVATRVGGNPELVEDGVTGTLVPVTDRPALSRALAAYAGDPHIRALHGKAARQRAVDEFSLNRMIARHAGLYRETLTGRPR